MDARETPSTWSESYGATGGEKLDTLIEAGAVGVVCIEEAEGVLDQSASATIQRLKFRVLLSMHKGESLRCHANSKAATH
jgi:hypothetical protein